MKYDTTNECAFPCHQPEEMGIREGYFSGGMSLRAYFAAEALKTFRQDNLGYGTVGNPENPWPGVARECIRAADALIEELNR
jgi:hypothetical protein